MKKHNYRIVKPFRFFIFVLICVMLIIFAGYGLLSIGAAEAETTDTYAHVIIQENDTLWDIASHYNPDADIREVVHDIYDINGITANDVVPGLAIDVPVY